MLIQEKKYKDYLAQDYEPVDETTMPFLVDIRAISSYAAQRGTSIVSLSDEEKQQFMIPPETECLLLLAVENCRNIKSYISDAHIYIQDDREK